MIPRNLEDNEISTWGDFLSILEWFNKTLQSNSANAADVRAMFKSITGRYPTMERLQSVDVIIVHKAGFEYALVEI